jgi:hypothetical protein
MVRLQDAQSTNILRLEIGGVTAYRFEVTGKAKNGMLATYMLTVFEDAQELITVNVWATSAVFEKVKDSLVTVVDSVSGLTPPFDAEKVAAEYAKKLAAEEDAKKVVAAGEARNLAAAEEARLEEEERLKQAKAVTEKKSENAPSTRMQVASTSTIDFNFEANKAARILGCQPTEVKVTGVDGADIQYSIACISTKPLNLSCDPTGLCLAKQGR